MLLKKPLMLRGLMTCLAGFLALAVGSTETRASSKICFTSQETGDYEVFVMDSDGSNVVNLTDNPLSNEYYCSWSPDGSQVAFVSDQDGDWEIYRVDADGSNETRLTDSAGNDLSPAWSPDGTLIAFSSHRDGNMEIYVMDASDGSDPDRLTYNSSPAQNSYDYGPSWSPDGTEIAFQSKRDGDMEIYKMDADGSNQTNLTNHPFNDTQPALVDGWERDRLQFPSRWEFRDLQDGCRWFGPDKSHESRRIRFEGNVVPRRERDCLRFRSGRRRGNLRHGCRWFEPDGDYRKF